MCERNTEPVANTETDTWRRTTRWLAPPQAARLPSPGHSEGSGLCSPGPRVPAGPGFPLTEALIPQQVSGGGVLGPATLPRLPKPAIVSLVCTVKTAMKRPVVESPIEKGRVSPSLMRRDALGVIFCLLWMHPPENVRAQWVSDEAARAWGASGAQLALGTN